MNSVVNLSILRTAVIIQVTLHVRRALLSLVYIII